jgi:uncharacterized phosphosugar-binding protein
MSQARGGLEPGHDVSQLQMAGDLFAEFTLQEVDKCRQRLASITKAADAAADRILTRNGEFLTAGDDGFAQEGVWRAGGIAFARRWKPDKPVETAYLQGGASSAALPYYRTSEYDRVYVRDATSNDVVLLGFENEREEEDRLAPYVQQLLASGALVILFGSEELVADIESVLGKKPNLITITHNVPNGGVIDIPSRSAKVCSGRSFVQRLNLWVFEAEIISGFLRRGKMPGILLSVTYESPQIFNLPLMNSYRFIPDFNITPVEGGALGSTYLDEVKRILAGILQGQREKFHRGSQWLAEALRNGHKAYALLIHGITPPGLPGDPNLFSIHTEGNAQYPELENTFTKDDVAVFVGYNWYPPELARTVDKAGGKLVCCTTTVQDLPLRAVMYGTEGPLFHVTSLDQLPTRENHIYIDIKFPQYDATLKIPGYPVLANPSSQLADNMVYQIFAANTVELLAGK